MEKEKILNVYKRRKVETVFEEVKSLIMPIAKRVVGNAFDFEDEDQLVLGYLSANGYAEEKDGKVYPIMKLDVCICEKDGERVRNVYVVLTPFNCYYYGYRTEFSRDGKIMPTVNLAYREYMKENFGSDYSKILRKYTRDVNTINGLNV